MPDVGITMQVNQEAALPGLSDVLHDAVFSRDSIDYDPVQQTVKIDFWREVPSQVRRSRRLLLFERVEILRARSTLLVQRARELIVHVRDRLDYYSVFRFDFSAPQRRLTLLTEGAISVRIEVDELDLELHDTGETTWDQFGYTSYVFRFPIT